MATDKPDLSEAVRRLAESRRPQEHPAPEKLAEYHARELPADEISGLQDHLAECPECSQMLLDLEAFEELEPPAGQRAVSGAQMRRDWKRLRRRLRSEDGQPRVADSADRGADSHRSGDGAGGEADEYRGLELSPYRARLRRPGRLFAAAAAVVVVGVGIWAVGNHLRSSWDLKVNVPPVELRPEGVGLTRSGEAATSARDLYTTGAYLLLHGAPAPSGSPGGYEVVIREASSGAVRLRRGDLQPLDQGFFSLVIAPGVLPAGDYRIEVRPANATGADSDSSLEYELRVGSD